MTTTLVEELVPEELWQVVAALLPARPRPPYFEQRLHVRHRLDRYGTRRWLELAEPPAYRPVASDGAARAAALMAELL